jgi:hypothetical protein
MSRETAAAALDLPAPPIREEGRSAPPTQA